jgi:hypothetical protein
LQTGNLWLSCRLEKVDIADFLELEKSLIRLSYLESGRQNQNV